MQRVAPKWCHQSRHPFGSEDLKMDGGGGGGEGELPRPLRLRSRQKEATVGRKERNTPRSLARRTGANRAAM